MENVLYSSCSSEVVGGAMGDAHKGSLYGIWHGVAFEKLRDRYRARDFEGLGRCRQCSLIQEAAQSERAGSIRGS